MTRRIGQCVLVALLLRPPVHPSAATAGHVSGDGPDALPLTVLAIRNGAHRLAGMILPLELPASPGTAARPALVVSELHYLGPDGSGAGRLVAIAYPAGAHPSQAVLVGEIERLSLATLATRAAKMLPGAPWAAALHVRAIPSRWALDLVISDGDAVVQPTASGTSVAATAIQTALRATASVELTHYDLGSVNMQLGHAATLPLAMTLRFLPDTIALAAFPYAGAAPPTTVPTWSAAVVVAMPRTATFVAQFPYALLNRAASLALADSPAPIASTSYVIRAAVLSSDVDRLRIVLTILDTAHSDTVVLSTEWRGADLALARGSVERFSCGDGNAVTCASRRLTARLAVTGLVARFARAPLRPVALQRLPVTLAGHPATLLLDVQRISRTDAAAAYGLDAWRSVSPGSSP
jgi:hypothetical protein